MLFGWGLTILCTIGFLLFGWAGFVYWLALRNMPASAAKYVSKATMYNLFAIAFVLLLGILVGIDRLIMFW